MKTKTGALPNSAGFPGTDMIDLSLLNVNFCKLVRKKMESESIKRQKVKNPRSEG